MIQIKRKITYIDSEGNKKNRNIEVAKKDKKNVKWTMKYMNVGYYLAVPLLVGVFLGNWLDTIFHTKPVFILSLLFIGMIAAFYNLYKITKDA